MTMKRIWWAAVLACAMTGLASAREMSVQIRNGQLREAPSFLGRLIGTVAYGDRLTVQEERGDWLRVTASGGVTGWIHQSALTPKKIVMQAGAADVSKTASGQELALAGKGFNSDVEADFKKKNAEIDFTWIDRMEKIKVSSAEMMAFLKEGEVKPNR